MPIKIKKKKKKKIFLEVDTDEKEKVFTIISSLEHFTILAPNDLETDDHCIRHEKFAPDYFENLNV